MPRREDERYSSRLGAHPVYCTCVDCTRRFLDRNNRASWRGIWSKLSSKFRRGKAAVHPAECSCGACKLLRSLDETAPVDNRESGQAESFPDQR